MEREGSQKNKDLLEILKILAPGTQLREGLDNVLRAKTGALIILSDSPKIMDIVAGGFHIDCAYSPASLYELAKMDGAIILNKDATKILYANAHLNPDQSVPSTETGIRHRTAERVARQTDELVISISQRRNVITLYKGELKYFLKDIGVLLSKANQAIQTLEKYKTVLDEALNNLSASEYDNLVTVPDITKVLQRAEMFIRVEQELDKFTSELGVEGRLIKMQVEELISNVQNDEVRTIMDYQQWNGEKSINDIIKRLRNFTSEDLLDQDKIARELGFHSIGNADNIVTTRGYRLLHKIPRLPSQVINNLLKHFDSFNDILEATIEELDDVEGIGEVRAKNIRDGLRRLREQIFLDHHWQ